MSEKEHHHVHFPEGDDSFEKHNEIAVQCSSSGDSISVHLGFLQISHRYEITVELPLSVCLLKESSQLLLRDTVPGKVQSVNCKMIEISKSDSGFTLKLELFAHKEKLLKENLYLESNDEISANGINLILIARVLGKGKGTPLLKNGIHCIGVELEDDSEASDWQGF